MWNAGNITRIFTAITLFIAAAVLVITAGLPNRADYTGQFVEGVGYVAPEIGAFAPPITAKNLDGTVFQLEQPRDKTLILNFWATWCEPCQAEMPLLQAIQDECSAYMQVMGMNADENPIIVTDWLKTNQITFVILIDENHQLQTRYRVLGLPSTFVISPSGKIHAIFYGAVTETALRATFETCIAD